MTYDKIGNHLRLSQYGISIEMNTEGIGYPIYRMNEMHNMLCDIDVDKYADISKDDYAHFALKQGDVLFNRTNSFEWVGRTGVYYPTSNNEERTFASYLVRFNPTQETILPEYLCTFLNSRYGVWDIKRRARQSINQTNVNPEEVKEIDIPLLRMDIQLKIQKYFKFANVLRLQSRLEYDEANQHLNQLLGIDNFVLTDGTITEKKYTDFVSSTRLDAEYYQPKYDELFALLGAYDTKTLSEIVNIEKSIEPGSEAYQTDGIPFIRVANLSKFGITDTDVYLSAEEYGDIMRPKKDTILLSKDGSVGIAYKVEENTNIITSGAILHLTVKDDSVIPDYLTLVLNSIIVKMQAERDAGGSVIQHWKPSEIENVVIPILDNEVQVQITEKVQESFALRRESARLLELAKTAVEVAIEQGEDKAMELLTQNM